MSISIKSNLDGSSELLNNGTSFVQISPTNDVAYNSQEISYNGNVQIDGNVSASDFSGGRLGSQGAISGDRNRVINGSMQIVNQATFVGSNNAGGYGGPEMFAAANIGAGGQFTQSQGSLTWEGISLPTVRQTVDSPNTNISAENYWTGIRTVFEGHNVFDLTGKPVVISFIFKASASGTYSVALRTLGTIPYHYVSTFTVAANTPTRVVIPASAIPLAASIPNDNLLRFDLHVGFLNTGVFQTATLNQWSTITSISATGATNWGATAGNFIELTNLQLEEGTVATPFIRRSYSQEHALTQRYYEDSGPNFNGVFRYQGTNAIAFGAFFSLEKRVVPTITGTFDLNDGAETSVTSALGTAVGVKSFSFSIDGTGFVDLNTWAASARL